jgi:hypothetical protein
MAPVGLGRNPGLAGAFFVDANKKVGGAGKIQLPSISRYRAKKRVGSSMALFITPTE